MSECDMFGKNHMNSCKLNNLCSGKNHGKIRKKKYRFYLKIFTSACVTLSILKRDHAWAWVSPMHQ